VYVYLGGRDMDQAFLSTYGLTPEGRESPTLKAVVCPRRRESCPRTADHCSKCGSPTDPTQLCGLESERAWVDPIMKELLYDPETEQFLVRRIRELNLLRFISKDMFRQEPVR
jgi:hypothetical protein